MPFFGVLVRIVTTTVKEKDVRPVVGSCVLWKDEEEKEEREEGG
jgi:hypothetical protein